MKIFTEVYRSALGMNRYPMSEFHKKLDYMKSEGKKLEDSPIEDLEMLESLADASLTETGKEVEKIDENAVKVGKNTGYILGPFVGWVGGWYAGFMNLPVVEPVKGFAYELVVKTSEILPLDPSYLNEYADIAARGIEAIIPGIVGLAVVYGLSRPAGKALYKKYKEFSMQRNLNILESTRSKVHEALRKKKKGD